MWFTGWSTRPFDPRTRAKCLSAKRPSPYGTTNNTRTHRCNILCFFFVDQDAQVVQKKISIFFFSRYVRDDLLQLCR